MKRSLLFFLAVLFLFFGGSSATHAQEARTEGSHVRQHPLSQAEINRIIGAFSANETLFRKALNEYGFKRDATIHSIGMGGQITGEYHRVSQFVFDDASRRYERITHFPAPTLSNITQEDLDDLGGVQAFALEASKIDAYGFSYLGKERIDELDLYVFDVTPKSLPDPKKTKERFFQGRIWVDDQDLQIVKARGKGIPEGKQRFPVFESYREQIDGRYWFPTYTFADDTLVFPDGSTMHVRMRVSYTDYNKLKGRVEILDDEGDTTAPPANSGEGKKPAAEKQAEPPGRKQF